MTTVAMNPPAEAASVELVVLQGTSFCNLDCTYCDLSRESRNTRSVMSQSLVSNFFTQLFAGDRCASAMQVIWHSGEPLTLSPEYYETAIAEILRLQAAFAPDISVTFDIQTNAVLINEKWCDFFLRHASHLSIGVSCDGPPSLHDAYRVDRTGRATSFKAERGMRLLEARGIKYKIIAVVTDLTLGEPESFFKFFFERRHALSGFHFNVLAGSEGQDGLSYTPDDRQRYYGFYRTLLALSKESQGRGALEIENFSQALARILAPDDLEPREPPSRAPVALRSLTVDASGEVTTFYAGLSTETLRDAYGDGKGLSIGNLHETELTVMFGSPKLERMSSDFARSDRSCRDSCAYHAQCPGGFELTKKIAFDRFDATETPECVVHVQALTDAMLDEITNHLRNDSRADDEQSPAQRP